MRQVDASSEIPAPPAEVFAFLADPANLPRWQAGIIAAERTSPEPVGIGATARVVRELAGQRIAVDLVVTEYEPERRIVLESAVSGIGVVATLELGAGRDGTTDLRFSMSIRAQNLFMAPLEGMVAGAAESDLPDSLKRLKAVFEDR